MSSNKVVSVICAALILSLLSGCLWAPELDRVRKDIERQLPGAHFKKDVAFSLGPIALALVKAAVRFVPDTDEARSYLRYVRDVKVAVYEGENVHMDANVRIPKTLRSLLDRDDWELVVKTHDEEGLTWILCRMDGESIRGLYVLVLNSDELVLVRASGRLDRLFERAMREHMNLDNGTAVVN